MPDKAYTLGNPAVYDEQIEYFEGTNRRLYKQEGGAVFWSLEAAVDALTIGQNGYYLPDEWFDGNEMIPGAIYEIEVSPEQVTEETDEVGSHALTRPAPIVRKVGP